MIQDRNTHKTVTDMTLDDIREWLRQIIVSLPRTERTSVAETLQSYLQDLNHMNYDWSFGQAMILLANYALSRAQTNKDANGQGWQTYEEALTAWFGRVPSSSYDYVGAALATTVATNQEQPEREAYLEMVQFYLITLVGNKSLNNLRSEVLRNMGVKADFMDLTKDEGKQAIEAGIFCLRACIGGIRLIKRNLSAPE